MRPIPGGRRYQEGGGPSLAADCSEGDFAGDVAGGSAEEVGDVDAELVEQAGVLVGVDLVGQFLSRLGRLCRVDRGR